MASLYRGGGETQSVDTEGVSKSAATTFDLVTFRSGAVSYKCNSGAGSAIARITVGSMPALSLGRWYRNRVYMKFDHLPASTTSIQFWTDAGAVTIGSARLTSGGKLQLWNSVANSQIGSDSAATIVTGQWYRIELGVLTNTGSIDQLDLYLDGVQVASGSGIALSESAPSQPSAGWCVGGVSVGANKVCYVDDIAVNDDQGASQNSWPGIGKVVLLVPISDNARDTLWTGGAGGTTNLYDAVNNTPPIGTATETNLTQIEHAGGAGGTTDRYDANMTTYATAGIGASDTINVVSFTEVDGEDVSTGTKLLNFEVLSNPVIASPGNVAVGNDAGALGTYPTTWAVRINQGVTYSPSVTVETSPVMRVRRPETATRVASVCFMGIYVDYTPAPTAITGAKTEQVNQAVNRAATY